MFSQEQLNQISEPDIRARLNLQMESMLIRNMKLNSTTKPERIMELYDIYLRAQRNGWRAVNDNGLKKIMIQHQVSKLPCFGCNANIHISDTKHAVFIKIYKLINIEKKGVPIYLCCYRCARDSPNINIVVDDARRFQASKDADVINAKVLQEAIDLELSKIRHNVAQKNIVLGNLVAEFSSLSASVDINEAMLNRLKNRDALIKEELEKQSKLAKMIEDAENETDRLKDEYASIFEKHANIANSLSAASASVSTLTAEFDNIITASMEKLLDVAANKIKQIRSDTSSIETSAETITETLVRPIKCNICICNQDEIWALNCGHAFCKPCTNKVRSCPVCNTPKQHILRIYI